MSRITTLVALLALAACDSATSADRGARDAEHAAAKAPAAGASFSGGTSHRAAIASVRRRDGGSPAHYEARGLAVDGGEVTVQVRSSGTIGFMALTSGTLVAQSTGTGEVNVPFQATSGMRYLVVAYPSTSGVLDAAHAHYLEAVP